MTFSKIEVVGLPPKTMKDSDCTGENDPHSILSRVFLILKTIVLPIASFY